MGFILRDQKVTRARDHETGYTKSRTRMAHQVNNSFHHLIYKPPTPIFPYVICLFLSFPPLRGFHSDQGFLSWSLPLSEFYTLIEKQVFQILQANINAILSTLEAVGKTPDRIDEDTKNLVKV